jgi:hypothetical protein
MDEPERTAGSDHLGRASDARKERAHGGTRGSHVLKENLQREILGAASLQQLDRAVEIDIGSGRELGGVTRRKAGALEFVLPPALDSAVLVLLPNRCLEGVHWGPLLVALYPFFGD